MGPKEKARIERQVELGAEASAIVSNATKTCGTCGYGTTIFKEREEQIIREAINWLQTRTGTSDDHLATRFIARLAEIRDLAQALGYRLEKADQARAKLYATEQAAE